MPGKIVVSTPVDQDTLERLNELCGKIHRTRAEVLRGLLYSLLMPEKYFIIDEWRAQRALLSEYFTSAKTDMGTIQARIMRAIERRHGEATVRELKRDTNGRRVLAKHQWDSALAALISAGAITLDVNADTRKKTVRLAKSNAVVPA
jgi:hypothetical protein